MKPVPATFKVGAPGDFHYYLPRTIVIVRHAEYNLVSFYQDMAQPSVEKWDGWHAMRQKGYVKGMIGKISKRGIERTGIHERATTSYVCDSQIILLLLVLWYLPLWYFTYYKPLYTCVDPVKASHEFSPSYFRKRDINQTAEKWNKNARGSNLTPLSLMRQWRNENRQKCVMYESGGEITELQTFLKPFTWWFASDV